ncbi:TrbC/VirB2 family protein [Legionella longbeachae]|uniref:TrbC/VirB2 family protein n=1 Tax=Legionella longbeachae TaxID=450 RepID=UPI0001BEBC99|nr:TrbC/VirB2 family protein [Legionella longbeachae]EEZ95955.1 Legionella vir-like protein LvhB2 [Legionella longbeachae D-4968]
MKKLINKLTCKINNRVFLALALAPTSTFAASIESILNNTVRFLQGPVAKAVGLVAIVGTGYLCIAQQKLPKERFVMILVGLGIIFGGSSLYSLLIG